MEIPKIGQTIQNNLRHLLDWCANHDPEEIINLSSKEYSNEVFGISYPLLCTPEEAALIKADTGQSRYWAKHYEVLGHEVVATSQWYDKHYGQFLTYLLERGLTPVGLPADFVEAKVAEVTAPAQSTPTLPSGARYKIAAIGAAQNLAVRNVLARIGVESFSKKNWIEATASFQHSCAYCGSQRQLVMDHAIPISVNALGEHRLGNLVPACRTCNANKGQMRYDDFLHTQDNHADAAVRIATIERHMRAHDYQALSETFSAETIAQVQNALARLRDEVAQAATAASTAISEIVSDAARRDQTDRAATSTRR